MLCNSRRLQCIGAFQTRCSWVGKRRLLAKMMSASSEEDEVEREYQVAKFATAEDLYS